MTSWEWPKHLTDEHAVFSGGWLILIYPHSHTFTIFSRCFMIPITSWITSWEMFHQIETFSHGLHGIQNGPVVRGTKSRHPHVQTPSAWFFVPIPSPWSVQHWLFDESPKFQRQSMVSNDVSVPRNIVVSSCFLRSESLLMWFPFHLFGREHRSGRF